MRAGRGIAGLVGVLAAACTPDTKPESGPCGDGGWGPGDVDPDVAVHVRADGDDAAAGTVDAPLASVGAAVSAAAEAGGGTVFVGPGTFPAGVDLPSGVQVAGCGMDETTLTPPDPATPASILVVDRSTGVTLSGLSLDGGRRALAVYGAAELEARELRVSSSVRSAIQVYGAGASVQLVDVEVLGVTAEETGGIPIGYGVSVKGGDATADGAAHISMEGGEIREASGAGLLLDTSVITLVGVEVVDTRTVSWDGADVLGRGVQIQAYSEATLEGCEVRGSADAGVFVSSAWSFTLTGSSIVDTRAGAVPGTGEPTGDGLVVRRAEADASFDPSYFDSSVVDSVLDANARAGGVFENVTVTELRGNSGTNAYSVDGSSFLSQGAADLSAAEDGWATPAAPLLFDTTLLGADEDVR